jgi:hypothetical protein
MNNTIFGPVIQHKLSIEEATRKARTLINKALPGLKTNIHFSCPVVCNAGPS